MKMKRGNRPELRSPSPQGEGTELGNKSKWALNVPPPNLSLTGRVIVLVVFLFLLPTTVAFAADFPDTWANWNRRLTEVFRDLKTPHLPGKTLGIVVPNEPRRDILALTALSYDVLDPPKAGIYIILFPAPPDRNLNGLLLPEQDVLATSFGQFAVDTTIRDTLVQSDFPVYKESAAFSDPLPKIVQTQLAILKYLLRGQAARVKILPIMVKLTDINSQSKDMGPFLAETIKDLGLEEWSRLIIAGNLTRADSVQKLIEIDSQLMNALRNLDVDTAIQLQSNDDIQQPGYQTPDLGTIVLGLMTLRWLGADHAEIIAYAHSAQLVLTKDKSRPVGYLAAGFPSEPPFPPKIKHVDRDKYVEVFDAPFRTDILAVIRQTIVSILDPTAAKPPTLVQKQAGKKWPVFITLYDSQGNTAGQAGTHEKKAPLEESIRQYSFEAVKAARPELTKDNVADYVIEASIPYGFTTVDSPEELIPLLNGIIVKHDRKEYAFHPNHWRVYPHPHQLLSAICHKLGLKPWAYVTKQATIESFRVLSFNEKEPFQDLAAPEKKKLKEKKSDENAPASDVNFDIDGAFPF